jgi:GT2 family glycosyltransferase
VADRHERSAAAKVAVVIVAWNHADEVARCLESCADLDYEPLHVIVVDNASADDTVAVVRARFPSVTLVENARNLGYAGGSNAGFARALADGADYVLLLNQDVRVTPQLVRALVAVIESDPRIAIAGAKNLLMDDPSRTWGCYGRLTWGPMLVETVGRFELDRDDRSTTDVDWVIGNGCLLRAAALRAIGPFDAELFHLQEDVEWCTRARRRGLRVVYVPAATLLHRGTSSSRDTDPTFFSNRYFIGRNIILVARKYARLGEWAKLLALTTTALVLRIVLQAGFFAFAAARDQLLYLRGVLDALRQRPPAPAAAASKPSLAPTTAVGRFVAWIAG